MHGTFGLSEFRPGQREVIEAVVRGRDTVAIMPTGAGKSLCYQLPALHLPGTTIVVSPLIALMKDQADKLNELGVVARQINSAIPPAFLSLGTAVKSLRSPPVLALTATATERVVDDIVKVLGLREPRIVNLGIYRPNLQYRVHHTAKESAKD